MGSIPRHRHCRKSLSRLLLVISRIAGYNVQFYPVHGLLCMGWSAEFSRNCLTATSDIGVYFVCCTVQIKIHGYRWILVLFSRQSVLDQSWWSIPVQPVTHYNVPQPPTMFIGQPFQSGQLSWCWTKTKQLRGIAVRPGQWCQARPAQSGQAGFRVCLQ